jgi:hypothetical protein
VNGGDRNAESERRAARIWKIWRAKRLDRGTGTRFHVAKLCTGLLILLDVKTQASPWRRQLPVPDALT